MTITILDNDGRLVIERTNVPGNPADSERVTRVVFELSFDAFGNGTYGFEDIPHGYEVYREDRGDRAKVGSAKVTL